MPAMRLTKYLTLIKSISIILITLMAKLLRQKLLLEDLRYLMLSPHGKCA
jgi:hypothetical protein